jgi:hypothetical protein
MFPTTQRNVKWTGECFKISIPMSIIHKLTQLRRMILIWLFVKYFRHMTAKFLKTWFRCRLNQSSKLRSTCLNERTASQTKYRQLLRCLFVLTIQLFSILITERTSGVLPSVASLIINLYKLANGHNSSKILWRICSRHCGTGVT